MKYIVYKTTNIINNYIYIGVHKTANPDLFDGYLGCGVNIKSPRSYEKAKTCFQQAVKQFGYKNFIRETLAIYNTPEEAYALEELLVNEEFLKRNDVYNMVLGGIINYASGKHIYMYSSESGNFIKEFDSLNDAAQEINCDASTISHSIKFLFKIKNFIFSYEKKEKVNLDIYNFKYTIKIYRYLKTGEYDKEFTSLNQAGKETLNTSAVYIQKASMLGYLVKDNYYFSFYKYDTYDKARAFQILNRQVFKYDSSGNFEKEYITQADAEKENPNCNITNSIKFKTPDKNGNFWSIIKLNEFNKPIYRSAKQVGKYDENGNLLQTWDSSNQCAKDVGVAVKNVLVGKYTHHKGFIYRYIV